MKSVEVESGRVRANYRHPMELAYYTGLTPQQKRRMLTAWANASNADSENPLLRRDAESGVTAHIDEIQEALRAIRDDAAHREPPAGFVLDSRLPTAGGIWWEPKIEGLEAAE